MIDVQTAVKAAVAYVREFQELIPPREIRLEETDHTDSGDWLITLSFLESPITGMRSYKVFRINGATGAVLSMKSRSLASAR